MLADISLDAPVFPSPLPAKHCPRVPRRFPFSNPPQTIEEPQIPETKPVATLACFEVALSGNTVTAFSIYEFRGSEPCGVVVRDGSFLRYGRITRVLGPEEGANSAFQIVMFDTDGALGRHITRLTNLATTICTVFCDGTGLVVRDIEVVSFRARSLLRVKVAELADGDVDRLTERLISTFAMAVEIFDDNSS